MARKTGITPTGEVPSGHFPWQILLLAFVIIGGVVAGLSQTLWKSPLPPASPAQEEIMAVEPPPTPTPTETPTPVPTPTLEEMEELIQRSPRRVRYIGRTVGSPFTDEMIVSPLPNIKRGEIQVFSVWAGGDPPVKEVTAIIKTASPDPRFGDKVITTVPLSLIEGNRTFGRWIGWWVVHGDIDPWYFVDFRVEDEEGNVINGGFRSDIYRKNP